MKHFVSILLALVMLVVLCPLYAFADEITDSFAGDLVSDNDILFPCEPFRMEIFSGDDGTLEFFTSGGAIDSAQLVYGTDSDPEMLVLTAQAIVEEGHVSVVFPEAKPGTYYYYILAKQGEEEWRSPSQGLLSLTVYPAEKKMLPVQVTLSPGTDYSKVGINWITAAQCSNAHVNYWKEGDSQIKRCDDVVIKTITSAGDAAGYTSYSADIRDLDAGCEYSYQIVTELSGIECSGDICRFVTMPSDGKVTFAVVSDLRGDSVESFQPYYHTYNGFLANKNIDFTIHLGNLTEDNTPEQWECLFDSLGDVFERCFAVFAPGAHESIGDALYTAFASRTNLPGGVNNQYIGETTSSFVAGNCCFVGINTEPYTGLEGADVSADKSELYKKQFEYAKAKFEESGCMWRIIFANEGTAQDDAEAAAYIKEMCDQLDVDIFFSGNALDYSQTSSGSAKQGGQGASTSFVTLSPMGEKFDADDAEAEDASNEPARSGADIRQCIVIGEIDGGELRLTAYQRSGNGSDYASSCRYYDEIDSLALQKDAPEQTDVKSVILFASIAVVALIALILLKTSKKEKDF